MICVASYSAIVTFIVIMLSKNSLALSVYFQQSLILNIDEMIIGCSPSQIAVVSGTAY